VTKWFIIFRGGRYAEILEGDPSQEQFAVSWLRRMNIEFRA
jgi:hypothetical protein